MIKMIETGTWSNVYPLDRISPSFSPTLRFHRRDWTHVRLRFRFSNETIRLNESNRSFRSRSRIDRVIFEANFTPKLKMIRIHQFLFHSLSFIKYRGSNILCTRSDPFSCLFSLRYRPRFSSIFSFKSR